jgi:hypothetical protein
LNPDAANAEFIPPGTRRERGQSGFPADAKRSVGDGGQETSHWPHFCSRQETSL